jgi:hypothetical protein
MTESAAQERWRTSIQDEIKKHDEEIARRDQQ